MPYPFHPSIYPFLSRSQRMSCWRCCTPCSTSECPRGQTTTARLWPALVGSGQHSVLVTQSLLCVHGAPGNEWCHTMNCVCCNDGHMYGVPYACSSNSTWLSNIYSLWHSLTCLAYCMSLTAHIHGPHGVPSTSHIT